jgi:hypothetical protein
MSAKVTVEGAFGPGGGGVFGNSSALYERPGRGGGVGVGDWPWLKVGSQKQSAIAATTRKRLSPKDSFTRAATLGLIEIFLSSGQNRFSDFAGNGEKYKAINWKKIILASLVDDAHAILAFSIGFRQNRSNLATLERHFMVGVLNTSCYTMIRILFCHSLVQISLDRHLACDAVFIPVKLSQTKYLHHDSGKIVIEGALHRLRSSYF